MTSGTQNIDQELYQKYSRELYGVLCTLTTGEPKNLVRGIVQGGFGQDGYKALVIFNKRYDARNGATLLHAFLETVNPAAFEAGELVSGIHKWETRMADSKNRYGEDLTPSVKLALVVGRLPKEYQDMMMQHVVAKGGEQMDYEQTREQIINLVTQKMPWQDARRWIWGE